LATKTKAVFSSEPTAGTAAVRIGSAGFIHRLNALHRAHVPSESLTIPSWALYDCAESSGFIVGLETPGGPGSDPDPLTMLAATPGMTGGAWHCLALRGRNDLLGATLEAGLGLAKPARMTGVVCWADPVLGVLAAGRRLGVLTAWTPAHSEPASATYLISQPEPDRAETETERTRLATRDEAMMRRVQGEIEAGRRAWIDGVDADGGVWVEIGDR